MHAAVGELWPLLTPEDFLADYLAEPVYVPDEDAEAIRRAPGDREWTPADVPLLDEAAELLGSDDSAERAAAEAERQERVAYAQGVLDLSRGSETYEFEDEEDSEVLAAHDIIDAERMAERQEEADHRSAAERAAADRTWAFGHIIVDEAQELSPMAWRLLMRRADPLADPGRRPGADVRGGGHRLLGEDPGAVRRRPLRARTARRQLPYARRDHGAGGQGRTGRGPDLRAARFGAVHRRGPVDAGRRADLADAVARAVAELTPEEGRLAVIAPRELHEEIAAPLDGITPGAEPDLTRPVVLLGPRAGQGARIRPCAGRGAREVRDERPVRGADPRHAAPGHRAPGGAAGGVGRCRGLRGTGCTRETRAPRVTKA